MRWSVPGDSQPRLPEMSQGDTGPPSWDISDQPAEQTGQPPEGDESAAPATASREREAGQDQEPEPGEQGSPEEAEAIQEPAKLIRLARMVRQLLDESREVELDEQTLGRLRTHVANTAHELGEVLSSDLRDELTRLRGGWSEHGEGSQPELRIEQAQLVGWLEGILQGIHNALAQEQGSGQQNPGQTGQPGQPGQQGPGQHGPPRPETGHLGGGIR